MNAKNRRSHRHARGMAIAQTALVTALVGGAAAAIAVDTGLMYNARAELQTCADAAALAAAAQLGGTGDVVTAARNAASDYAHRNSVTNTGLTINATADVVMGSATVNTSTGKYTFNANTQPYNAVQVTAHRDATASDGPVQLLFGRMVGSSNVSITASAAAMLVPRDIAVVIDLSGSMNDDSELRHFWSFPSESDPSIYRPAVAINLKDVWSALPQSRGANGVANGANPGTPVSPPTANNNQPSNGVNHPQTAAGYPDTSTNEPNGGSSNPAGPRWGWMTYWGKALDVGVYDPTTDNGLYYIPQNSTTTNARVVANVSTNGYSAAEQTALLSSANDGNSTYYRNRVRVLLGLAGWRSGKSGGKYPTGSGNGDNKVDSSELVSLVPYPYSNSGSWDDYIKYVASSSTQMYATKSTMRYRYGLKTYINYLLEDYDNHSDTPDLYMTPEQPVYSVKQAVQAMETTISGMQSLDQMSLEIFAQTAHHEVNLSTNLQAVPDRLNQMQSAHYDSVTNIGGGLNQGITELTSTRARAAATKVIVLMTDGKPNVDSSGNYVGDGAPSAVNYATNRAQYAADHNMTIYTVGVGGDCDTNMTQTIANIGHGISFYAGGTPDEYMPQLQTIFTTLGGMRAVQLIK